MPKGKKKGSGKLANMTDEQRILYEEELRREEENMMKKQEETLSQFLKLKLEKEEKAAQLNLWKLNHQWRNIMRDIKSKELRKDIEILSQTFERIVDRKDSVLKSLVKDLAEADEQYLVSLRSHMENMDRLIGIHQERMDNLKVDYEMQLATLKTEFDSEQEFMVVQHKSQTDDLKDILVAFDIHYTAKEHDAQSEFTNQCDEINNKNMEDSHALGLAYEKRMAELWQQLETVKKNYDSATAERRVQLDALRQKDESSASIINDHMRKIQRLQEQIGAVRQRLGTVSKDYEDKNGNLREERDRLVSQFQAMKVRMNQLRDLEREKLTGMSLQSNQTLQKLNSLSEKAERILKLGEMCRKLETEQEKVLPFYPTSLSAEEEADVKAAINNHDNTQGGGGSGKNEMQDWSELLKKYTVMDNFWKRFNKVKLDQLAGEKERSVLANENARLRAMLKQYLDGVSVNGEVLEAPNSLLVVNGNTNVNLSDDGRMDPRVKPVPTVTIEAAHVVKYGVTSETLFN